MSHPVENLNITHPQEAGETPAPRCPVCDYRLRARREISSRALSSLARSPRLLDSGKALDRTNRADRKMVARQRLR